MKKFVQFDEQKILDNFTEMCYNITTVREMINS